MSLCRAYGKCLPVMVTAFSTIRILPDTAKQIAAEVPNWLSVHDRRTKAWRRLRVIEMDIEALAEAEWLSGDELTEI